VLGPEVLARSSSSAGLAKVDLRSGRVALQAEAVEEETPSVKGGTPLDQLPPLVKELVAREKWQSAYVVGPRVYGQADVGDPRHRVEHRIQAVDVATGKLLWQRAFGEWSLPIPPP